MAAGSKRIWSTSATLDRLAQQPVSRLRPPVFEQSLGAYPAPVAALLKNGAIGYYRGMDRAAIQRHLERVQKDLATGERHIRRQREIVAEFERDGRDAQLARDVLATLEQVQQSHIAARDRLSELLERSG